MASLDPELSGARMVNFDLVSELLESSINQSSADRHCPGPSKAPVASSIVPVLSQPCFGPYSRSFPLSSLLHFHFLQHLLVTPCKLPMAPWFLFVFTFIPLHVEARRATTAAGFYKYFPENPIPDRPASPVATHGLPCCPTGASWSPSTMV